jgi:catechol 2,3-dioxygenase-like lactoylglutathione lyase family enzyme
MMSESVERAAGLADVGASPIPATLNHVGFMVSDLEATRQWCVDVLGAARTGDVAIVPGSDVRIGFVSLGSVELEVIEATADLPYPSDESELGVYHICVETTDVSGARAHLDGLGIKLVGFGGRAAEPVEISPGLSTFCFRDPDGLLYQVVGRDGGVAPGELPGPFDRGVQHVGFNVRSLEDSLVWYERVFGLRCEPGTGRDGMAGIYQPADLPLRSAVVPVGDFHLELIQWKTAGASPDRLSGLGPVHLGLEVDEIGSVDARALLGSEMLMPLSRNEMAGSRGFGRSYFIVADPDGLPVQALQEPDGA